MSFSCIKGVFFRYFYVFYKGSHSLADLFYWPLVDILLWGLTATWIKTQNPLSDLSIILITALIFWQMAWRGSCDIGVNLLQEFWNRNLVNLFSTPLKISEWSIGVILLSLFKLLITISFGAVVVYVLYTINIFSVGAYFLPFAISLIIFGWTVGFLAAGLIIYWGNQMEAIAWMIPFVFAPFCAVFYPVNVLPHWAQMISWCLPPTYIFEGMRKILSSGSFDAFYFWLSFLLDIVYVFLSFKFFKFMFEKSKIKGLARLE